MRCEYVVWAARYRHSQIFADNREQTKLGLNCNAIRHRHRHITAPVTTIDRSNLSPLAYIVANIREIKHETKNETRMKWVRTDAMLTSAILQIYAPTRCFPSDKRRHWHWMFFVFLERHQRKLTCCNGPDRCRVGFLLEKERVTQFFSKFRTNLRLGKVRKCGGKTWTFILDLNFSGTKFKMNNT